MAGPFINSIWLLLFSVATLKKKFFMLQPPSCIKPRKDHMVCKLWRSLYGPCQSPRAWYTCIDNYFRRHRMQCTVANPNVYYYRQSNIILLLVLYVDDLMFTCSNSTFIADLTRDLSCKFEIKDLGLMRNFLGIQLHRLTKESYFINLIMPHL
jgi:hypothetical protein